MKLDKQDYKINFDNIHYLIKYWIVYIVISIVLVTSALMMYRSDVRHYDTISSDDYSYVITSNTAPSLRNVYYRLDNLSAVITPANSSRNVYVYMENGYDEYDESPLFTPKLGKREVALSSKIAHALHLKVGDKVYLDINIYEERVEYTVAYIIDYVYDYYQYEDKSALSVVKIGYDANIEHGAKGVYMGFYNEAEYDSYMQNREPYVIVEYVKDENRRMETKLLIYDIISSVIFLACFGVFMYIIMRAINSEVHMLFFDGYRGKRLKKIILLDEFVLLWIPTLILDIFFAILSSVGVLSIITALINIIIPMLVLLILLMNRGKEYERAN